jgi:Cys/Met metabolism PLP-dependent enzyme
MTLATIAIWPQPLDPFNSAVFSALVAALLLILILVLRGGICMRRCPAETESLVQHQASSPTHELNTGLAENLLRLAVGLEHPGNLIADLEQAIHVASATRSVA